jgi:glyoxylase-like metal-dependent hydrolase (beta-lactamase superfamily II)/rhodanese-related sulfurtransferase
MREITTDQLKARIEGDEPVQVVDIRERGDHAAWSIVESANVPVYDALRAGNDKGLREAAGALDRSRPVVTVCRGGILSRRAAAVLDDLGFEAFSLIGGMRGWGGVWSEATIGWNGPGPLVQIRRNGKGCLSYIFGDAGEAAVVDPSVEIGAYLAVAERLGLQIVTVIETHVHADHLSRARELCTLTGATLRLPENGRVCFDYESLGHGDTFAVGGIEVEVLHTPGHTGESSCYLLNGEILLSGDTIFPRSVGRPDLEKGDAGAEAGARALYDSLTTRLFSRFDDIPFYACHHGRPIALDGEALGGSLRSLGEMLALDELGQAGFVERVLARLQAKPPNFEAVLGFNEGRHDLSGVDPLDLEAGPNCCAAG